MNADRYRIRFNKASPIILLSLTLVVVAPLAMPASSLAAEEQDWPCVQRKVARLSWGQMWAGPPLPQDGAWRDDPQLRLLAGKLAARRTDVEDVEDLLDRADPPLDDAALAQLYAGVLFLIDEERQRLIEGVERYARKQRALSEHIDARRAEIVQLREATAADDHDGLDKIDGLEDALAWDTRIYQDRRKSLTYVCESPITLEKRAFAIARIIQGRLTQ